MPVHLHSLVRSGVVSPRSYRRMMADHASAGEQNKGGGTVGAVSADAINDPAHTRAGSRANNLGLPDATARGGAPHVGANAINKKANRKKQPASGRLRGRGNPSGPISRVGVQHTPTALGPYYGGGGRR